MDKRPPENPAKPAQVTGMTSPAPEVSIIVPTFNERENIPLLVERIAHVLDGREWEIIFVDDNSPDGTSEVARALGERDRRVRCIRRIGRRGLAGASLEGMLASQASYVAVMDADLQHDEALLPAMLDRLQRSEADLVVASRYLDGASSQGLSTHRSYISRFASALARRLLGVNLSDPMSGFFMLRRAEIEAIAPALSTQGFKILLDILATTRGHLRIAELPYVFRQRLHGESKLDAKIALDFISLVIAKLTNDSVSYRFLLFCLVGLTGIVIHMAVLHIAVESIAARFAVAQTAATIVAITWNFILNNAFTYYDQRLTGWSFVTGLIRFQVICAIGAISNIGVASWIYRMEPDWWLAGFGGALLGAVWNYVVSAAFVWRQR